jgi:hypothetical protein
MENADLNKKPQHSRQLYELIKTMNYYQNYMNAKVYIHPVGEGEYING